VLRQAAGQEGANLVLPQGVKAVWDLDEALREKTSTRERICINGLWRWQPAAAGTDSVPADRWGYFKVPGNWPADARRGGSQTLYSHPSWSEEALGSVNSAWYQREVTIPSEWTDRRIALYAEYVNSLATVYIDGAKVGEIRFPAGEVDLTPACRPGQKHVLSVHVLALPARARAARLFARP
jgi:beta-galactosidase/beta-glucuronidase